MRAIFQWLFVVALAVWSVVAHSMADNTGYNIMGISGKSCGDWTTERKKGESWEVVARMSWVLGYVTAVNRFGPWSSNVAAGTDANGLLAWIDNYCTQHPLEDIETAGGLLVAELGQRAGSGR